MRISNSERQAFQRVERLWTEDKTMDHRYCIISFDEKERSWWLTLGDAWRERPIFTFNGPSADYVIYRATQVLSTMSPRQIKAAAQSAPVYEEIREAWMNPIVTVYKVVCRSDSGQLKSPTMDTVPELQVTYVPHEWVKAPVGGLLVFETMKKALEFLRVARGNGKERLEVWAASARQSIQLPSVGLIVEAVSIDDLRRYWRTKTPPPNEAVIGLWPFGTLAFKSVRLDRKVYPKEGVGKKETH